MTHTQESLAAFDGVESKQPSSPDQPSAGREKRTVDTSGTEFSDPEQFPGEDIGTLSSGGITVNLCTPDDAVSPTFQTVAGDGGMGASKSVDDPSAVADVLADCVGLPVLVTGGGMSTPMGSGAVLGRLLDYSQSDGDIRVELKELYRQQGRSRRETRTRRIGAYEVSLPASAGDCRAAIAALVAWERDEVDYLNPRERQKDELVHERLEVFRALSPADKVGTPEYATRLEVVSEPFETHAVIPRGTLSDQTVGVLAVVVNNPNGGYYQLGIDHGESVTRGSEVPTCYLSASSQSPLTPNTAFTRDAKFSSTDLEVTPIEHPPDPEVVPPDEDVLESPLPEPRLRTSIDDIDGVGEKTAMKLHRATDERVSADSLAYTMFGDGDIHTASLREIEEVLDSLPRKEEVFEQLKQFTPDS
jgi:hypothetical protein